MSKYKKMLTFFLVSLFVLTLTGCGMEATQNSDKSNGDNGDSPSENSEVDPDLNAEDKADADGKVSVNLVTVTDQVGVYELSLQNNKKDDVVLTFPSSQQFDYYIKHSNGKILHTFSANKSFMQTISEITIRPGETTNIPISIVEFLPQLNLEKYTLEVWVTAKDQDLKASLDFTVTEEMLNTLNDIENSDGLPLNDENESGETSGSNGSPEGIVLDDVTAQLFHAKDENGGISTTKFVLSIQNHQERAVDLEFPSSQEYDYHIVNEDNKVLFTFSSNKSFMQVISTKTLSPGEVYETILDISEYLPRLDDANYRLVAWLPFIGYEENNLKGTIHFTVKDNKVLEQLSK